MKLIVRIKMQKYKLLTIILFTVLSCLNLEANELVYMDHYSTRDGLENDYVTCIAQDKYGYIWIANRSGLNRFDGYGLWSKSINISSNDMPVLINYKDSIMFCGGSNGFLNSFSTPNADLKNARIPEMDGFFQRNIDRFSLQKNGILYMLTTKGLYYYNDAKEKFDVLPLLTDSTYNYFINSLYIDRYNNYWIGTFDGLIILSEKGEILSKHTLSENKAPISAILEVDSNKVLVSSNVGKLWSFEYSTDKIITKKILDIPFQNVSCMLKDRDNNIWFGTWGEGLWRKDSLNNYNKIIPLGNKAEELQKVHALFEDKDGNIWIGTQVYGAFRIRNYSSSFICHSSELGFPNVDCSCFIEDNNGDILIGSDGFGINKVNKNGLFVSKIKNKNKDFEDNVLSFCKENNDILFLSWTNGLCKIDDNSNISTIDYKGINNPIKSSKKIIKLKNGELWIGVQGDGVYVRGTNGTWDNPTLCVDSAFYDKWINDIEEGTDNTVWLMSSNGIWRMSDNNSLFYKIYDSYGHSLNINDGTCNKNGDFFFVKKDLIIKMDKNGNSIDTLNFLPVTNFYSIYFDEYDNLWCSSALGIMNINLENKSYKNYTIPEKYGKVQFLPRAIFQNSIGNLFFGCTNGFIMLNPATLSNIPIVSHLTISKLKNEDGIFDVSDHIKINYDKTHFSLALNLLTTGELDNFILRYKLRGYDDKWYNIERSNIINFNFLPIGTYNLDIEAFYLGAEKDKKTASLQITILPPWWQSWWFKLISFIFVLAIISLIIYARYLSMKRRQIQLEQMVNERTADLYSMLKNRDRIVSVVAHDLKNHIFSIVCGLDLIKMKIGSSIDSKCSKILTNTYTSSKKLQDQMVQLLDWATSNQGEFKFMPTNVDINSLIDDSISILKGLINEKKINITTDTNINNYAICDGRMIASVVRNLLNNSIKFTNKNGNIWVCAIQREKDIVISIKDDGVGMTQEQINALLCGKGKSTKGTSEEHGTGFGFKLSNEFVQQNGGSISIESNVNAGTTISFTVPLSDEIIEKFDSEEETKIVKTAPDLNADINIDKDLLNGNTMLIIDDDEMLRKNVISYFEPYISVLEAQNGDEGFSLSLKTIPDIIITDIEMPKINGLELASLLHENKSTVHIPLLFISANNSDKARVEGLSLGAMDFISKPFRNEELLLKVNNILNLRRIQQQNILTGVQSKETKQVINPLIKNILDIIEKNYQNPDFSVEELSKQLTISKSTLIRKLKSIADKTPVEILSEFRLKKADELLRQHNTSIKEIAFNVGFNDPYYFSRKYKEFFGYPPSEIKS